MLCLPQVNVEKSRWPFLFSNFLFLSCIFIDDVDDEKHDDDEEEYNDDEDDNDDVDHQDNGVDDEYDISIVS